MALHPDFPRSPYEILPPNRRWFPAAEALRQTAYEKLLPPLVAKVRTQVGEWRDAGYAGASDTSRALLHWWFGTDHLIEQADGTQSPFRYYFAQREAVETIVWLYDARGVRERHDLMRFDASGGARQPLRRRLAALRGQNGHRRRQDQGAVAVDGVVLLPQALRAGFHPGAQFPADRPQHHCAGPAARRLRRKASRCTRSRPSPGWWRPFVNIRDMKHEPIER